jgi:microcystin-dependent protein
MAEPFIGEIRMFAGNYAPAGWMFCNGQLLSIVENDVLFALIGTTYGGDGQSTFALPDLRGRIPLHQNAGGGNSLGQAGGAESVTVTALQMPAHTHTLLAASNPATGTAPAGQVLATTATATINPYGSDAPNGQLAPSTLSSTGGSQPHTNLQPYLCIDFIIALFGVYPSPS